ncbi:APC family permease [Acidianus manzaensis]|uniref:Amino acid permease n=1 Tax=Acidianus manzaensis TaxID=282676 RepID=A0A1W6JYY9_9CREN|nr:amino acid permease [Acidianus manzaensis]ARM75414.1 amino acid permease [Acidianus manzaensis]
MSGKNLFVRESSGLVKQVNATDSIMLNLGNMSAGIALFTSISPYITGGGIIWIAAIIGLILTLPQAYIYMFLSGKIPRTGGDYVWLSRLTHGSVGMTMGFALMIESTAFFALVAYFFSSAVGTVLSTIGSLDGIPSLVSLSSTLSTPLYSYLLGAVIFAIIIGFNIFKAKWGYKLVTVSVIISIITTIIAMGIIAVNIPDFHTAITPFLKAMSITPPSNYASSVSPFSIIATIGILPLLAIFTYPWMQATPAIAAEAKNVNYVKLGIIVPLLLTGAFVTIGFGLLYLAGGYAFTNYEFINNGFVYTFWTVAMGLTSNAILQWIIGIGLMIWEFSVLAYGVIVFSRYIFAMGFDRLLPEIFTRLNKAGSPVYTHIFDLALTLLFLVLPVISISGATALYGAIVIGMIYFFTVSIAAAKYGIQNKYWPVVASGIFEAGYFIFLTYEAVTNPVFGFAEPNGAPNPITLGFVIGAFVAGLAIYLVAKYYHKTKEGLNVDVLFKEIPPE